MTSAPNPFDAFRILTVVTAPVIVTVLAVPVKVEPAPDVSQLLVMVHAPVVNVTVDGPLLNAMSVNSAAPPGRTAKVIVWETDELNVMDAAKFQDADVDVFVQDPETVHEPAAPDVM